MIFTIGYDGKGFTTNDLCKILDDASAVLVDVRITPFSRMKGWGIKQLVEAVGSDRYIQRKDLGGGSDDKKAGIEYLKNNFDGLDAPNCVLLCKEENPAECHRHFEICLDENDETGKIHNFPHALHIYRDAIYRAESLSAKLREDSADMLSIVYTDELDWFCDMMKTDPQQFHDYLTKNPTA